MCCASFSFSWTLVRLSADPSPPGRTGTPKCRLVVKCSCASQPHVGSQRVALMSPVLCPPHLSQDPRRASGGRQEPKPSPAAVVREGSHVARLRAGGGVAGCERVRGPSSSSLRSLVEGWGGSGFWLRQRILGKCHGRNASVSAGRPIGNPQFRLLLLELRAD